MAKLTFLGLVGGVLAAVLAVLGNSQALTVLSTGLVLASIEVAALTYVAGGFTPLVIPVLTVNTVLLSSLLLWGRVQKEATVSVVLSVTEEYLINAAVIGIVFSASFTVGALFAGPRSVHAALGKLGSSITQLGRSFQIPYGALVVVGYAIILMIFYAKQGALLQGHYLESNGPHWAVILSTALTPLAMLELSIAAASHGPWRLLGIIGVGLLLLILFARATRMIAAFPALMVLASVIVSGRKIRARYLVLAAIATFALMQLVIVGRASPEVGIIPLGTQLFTSTDVFFSHFSLNALLGNILISGPMTAVVAQRPISSQALWVSLNPMPGALAGWPEIQRVLRFNAVTPYNALGELAAHGWVTLVVVAFVAGYALSLASRIASNLRGAYATTGMMMTLATVSLFSVQVLQYFLRTSIRLVWYTMFGVAALWLAQSLLSQRRTGQDPRIPQESDNQERSSI